MSSLLAYAAGLPINAIGREDEKTNRGADARSLTLALTAQGIGNNAQPSTRILSEPN